MEWNPYWQRRLLNVSCIYVPGIMALSDAYLRKAAKFGKAFIDLYNSTDFVDMGQTLKVLNAVRFYEIGIPITYTQYVAEHLTRNFPDLISYRYIQLSPTELIARLTSRNLHLLALRISSFLSLPSSPVLKHWACAKIIRSKSTATADAGLDDDAVCRSIVEKFEQLGDTSVSYAEIARKAWEIGRTDLATKVRVASLSMQYAIQFFSHSFLIMSPDRRIKYRCFLA